MSKITAVFILVMFLSVAHPCSAQNETITPKKVLYTLKSPAQVLADQKSGQLFIADSGNNRIVITDFNGQILDFIGTGQKGHVDGTFQRAEFSNPQGLALSDNKLYIADFENHKIRVAHLISRVVKTYAGTGEISRNRNVTGEALSTALNAPRDVLIHNEHLYISMEGLHQIWDMDMGTNTLRVFAGSGANRAVDGSQRRSSFSRPKWLALLDEYHLLVMDQKPNAIRKITLGPGGQVRSMDDPEAAYLFMSLVNNLYYFAHTQNNTIQIIPKVHRKIRTLDIYYQNSQSGFHFDFDNFFGERVVLNEKRSPWIRDILFNIHFPENFRLLRQANPMVNVFTKKNHILRALIEKNSNVYPLNLKGIDADELFVAVNLYYCREGKEGLCLIKNILYEIPLERVPVAQLKKQQDIVLNFQVKEDPS